MKFIIFYKVLEMCDTMFEVGTFHDINGNSAEYAAEDAAKDFYEHHDGYLDEFPMTFLLHATETGPEVCRFYVELEEYVPVFSTSPGLGG